MVIYAIVYLDYGCHHFHTYFDNLEEAQRFIDQRRDWNPGFWISALEQGKEMMGELNPKEGI